MTIRELRILPPLAIGRLGASPQPLEAFDLQVPPGRPLDFRTIVPQESFEIDPESGAIVRAYLPERIAFKDADGWIRPVAPFLEVFALTDAHPDELVPLTRDLLAAEGIEPAQLRWEVEVANIKLFRRTGDPGDKIVARLPALTDHRRQPLLGACDHFLPGRSLPLGTVQFIRPTPAFPQIRLRFTPAAGKVYGASRTRHDPATGKQVPDHIIDDEALVLYDKDKGRWHGYEEAQGGPTLTNPAQIFAGYNTPDPNAPDKTLRVSWGYLDDECDGVVRVVMRRPDGTELAAHATIGAGPPAFAPDTLPIRVVSDELEQILYGPRVREAEVSLDEAEAIVRRALETIRLMNTAVMNGNSVNGREDVASTMVRQDTGDFARYFAPIAAPALVDNLALRALHERVFSTLAAGGAPWFAEALRRPEEIGDLSDGTRRKMPALMRGADGRGLTLTRRQIDIVVKAAARAMFGAPAVSGRHREQHAKDSSDE
jgi:hypothetical protein